MIEKSVKILNYIIQEPIYWLRTGIISGFNKWAIILCLGGYEVEISTELL